MFENSPRLRLQTSKGRYFKTGDDSSRLLSDSGHESDSSPHY